MSAGEPSIEEERALRRKRALEKAVRNRKLMPKMRRAILAGVLDDEALIRGDLTEYEAVVSSFRIKRMLLQCRDIGELRAWRIIDRMGVAPDKRMRDLTYEQRVRMATLVHESRDVI